MTQKKQKPSTYSSLQFALFLLRNKKFSKAIAILEELKKEGNMKKVHPQIYHFLGDAFAGLENYEGATSNYLKALKNKKMEEMLLIKLAILHQKNRKDELAVNFYQRALKFKPDSAFIHNNMGTALLNLGFNLKAKKSFEKALNFNSKNPQANKNLAISLDAEGDFDKSVVYFKKSIKYKKTDPEAYYGLAIALLRIKKIKEAILYFKETISQDPSHFRAGLALCWAFFYKGDLIKTWAHYNNRWKVKPGNSTVWPFDKDRIWKGEVGGELVLWREQGIGDDILFLGLVPEARKKVSKLSVYVDPRLVSLCERSMLDIEFIPSEEKLKEKHFDYHLPMGSLPLHLRNTEKDFSKTVNGYLKADRKRVEVLREELGVKGKRVVGISWKSFKSLTQNVKSMHLKDLANLFKDLDITLVNLQYGDVDEEIREFTRSTGINILQCSSVDNRDDLDGLAALIELCDLVVSTSNVTIHLAGALGKETWVLLPFVSASWWLLDREDSVWYPSIRLYRQSSFRSWADPLLAIRNDLQKQYGS